MVTGLLLNSEEKLEHCHGCSMGKHKRLPFPKKSEEKSSRLLELIHTDVCGPMNVPSVGGLVYFVTFVDDYWKYVTVYTMKSKGEVLAKFMEFVQMAETFTGLKVKKIDSFRQWWGIRR